MDIESLTQYGMAVVTLGVLVYVIQQFIGVIKNHMTHSTESQNQLSSAINMMLKFLERNNK